MSRFDSFGDSSKPSGDRRSNNKDSGFSNFGGFSRSTFGTASEEGPKSNNTNNSKVQRPAKDSEGWERVSAPVPIEEKKLEKAPKQEKANKKAGGTFAAFDDDEPEQGEAVVAEKAPEKEKKSKFTAVRSEPQASKYTSVRSEPQEPPQAAPRFAAVVDAPSSFRRDNDARQDRFPREDRQPREDRPPRQEYERKSGFDQSPADFAGGSRFSGFDSGPTERRPPREDRPPRREFDRGDRPPRQDYGFDRPDRYQEIVAAPVVQKEAPKTITAGTNKDGTIAAANLVTQQASTGIAGLSTTQTQSASWGAAAPAVATGISFNTATTTTTTAEPKQPKQAAAPAPVKAAAETPLQKAVSGRANTVSLGQLKKNIGDIVPFPTIDDGKKNFATAIAFAISAQEYGIGDVVTILNKNFVDQYGRVFTKEGKSSDDGKKTGVDVSHDILVLVVKALLAGDDAAKAKVAEYFNGYDATKLSNFCPQEIFAVADDAVKKTKAIEFFKTAGIVACLSAQDGNDDAADTDAAKATVDVKVSTAIIALAGAVDAAAVKTIVTPLQTEIKTAITKDSVSFLTSLFAPLIEKNLSKDTIVALLDALFALGLLSYDMMDEWQGKCAQAVVKREMTFKIATWMSEHKPQQIQAYDDDEDEEPFDDGF